MTGLSPTMGKDTRRAFKLMDDDKYSCMSLLQHMYETYCGRNQRMSLRLFKKVCVDLRLVPDPDIIHSFDSQGVTFIQFTALLEQMAMRMYPDFPLALAMEKALRDRRKYILDGIRSFEYDEGLYSPPAASKPLQDLDESIVGEVWDELSRYRVPMEHMFENYSQSTPQGQRVSLFHFLRFAREFDLIPMVPPSHIELEFQAVSKCIEGLNLPEFLELLCILGNEAYRSDYSKRLYATIQKRVAAFVDMIKRGYRKHFMVPMVASTRPSSTSRPYPPVRPSYGNRTVREFSAVARSPEPTAQAVVNPAKLGSPPRSYVTPVEPTTASEILQTKKSMQARASPTRSPHRLSPARRVYPEALDSAVSTNMDFDMNHSPRPDLELQDCIIYDDIAQTEQLLRKLPSSLKSYT